MKFSLYSFSLLKRHLLPLLITLNTLTYLLIPQLLLFGSAHKVNRKRLPLLSQFPHRLDPLRLFFLRQPGAPGITTEAQFLELGYPVGVLEKLFPRSY
jgi:hypothetical protein